MRTSILSRSMIAVATLGIGAVALAGVPASAATPSGVTRDMVLTAAAGVRAAPAAPESGPFGGGDYGPAANRALKAMVNRVCVTDPDGPEVSLIRFSAATAGGGSADGVVVSAVFYNLDDFASETGRICSFGALAPVALRSVLAGTATLSGGPTTALSGDVFVTSPVNTPISETSPSTTPPTFSASGQAVQSDVVKVKDKKTKAEKKAAKKKYDSRLKAAKKAYTKALKKAGHSKSKKNKAKKAYSAAKKSAKTKYTYATAGYKLVTKKTGTPFSVSAQYTAPTPPPPPV